MHNKYGVWRIPYSSGHHVIGADGVAHVGVLSGKGLVINNKVTDVTDFAAAMIIMQGNHCCCKRMKCSFHVEPAQVMTVRYRRAGNPEHDVPEW